MRENEARMSCFSFHSSATLYISGQVLDPESNRDSDSHSYVSTTTSYNYEVRLLVSERTRGYIELGRRAVVIDINSCDWLSSTSGVEALSVFFNDHHGSLKKNGPVQALIYNGDELLTSQDYDG